MINRPRHGTSFVVSLVLASAAFSLAGCSKLTEPPKPEPVQEGAPAEAKQAQPAATPAPTPSPTAPAAPAADPNAKLEMKDLVVGKGAEAKAGDSVKVHYVGTLQNGTEFDASKKHGTEPFTFVLGQGRVIKGWDEGVAG